MSYFRMTNESGGINGRRVEYLAYDDGWDQQRSIQLAKRLVEQDKIFAMVGNFQFFTADGVVPYLEEKGIPLVGPESVALRELQSPISFPMSLSTCGNGISTAAIALNRGFKRPAVVYVQGNSAMNRVLDCQNAVFKEKGIEPVASVGTSLAEPDYTQAVLRIRGANPDVILLQVEASAALRVMQAMQRQNYVAPLVLGYPSYDNLTVQYAKNYPEQAKDISLPTGAVPLEAPTEEVSRYLSTVKKYFPAGRIGFFGEVSWAAAKLFTDVMRTLPGDPSRAQLIDALNGLRDYKNGIFKSITFNPGPKDPNRWWYVMKVDAPAGKFVPVSNDFVTHPCKECEEKGWARPVS